MEKTQSNCQNLSKLDQNDCFSLPIFYEETSNSGEELVTTTEVNNDFSPPSFFDTQKCLDILINSINTPDDIISYTLNGNECNISLADETNNTEVVLINESCNKPIARQPLSEINCIETSISTHNEKQSYSMETDNITQPSDNITEPSGMVNKSKKRKQSDLNDGIYFSVIERKDNGKNKRIYD